MTIVNQIRDFVLPGTFGKGRRAYLTGIVATIYQILIYVFVLASIYSSFMLYFRFGRINSFVTIYSELNGIETPSLIYCKHRNRFGNDINTFKGIVLMRILHYNRYYYSDNKNIRTCIYEGAVCLCIDAWKQSYYVIRELDDNNLTEDANKSSTLQESDSQRKLGTRFTVFHPGNFPVPLFIRDEIDYQISTRISMDDYDIKYKPHLINWCGLNIREEGDLRKQYNSKNNSNSNESSLDNPVKVPYLTKARKSSKPNISPNILCENKDMVELLFISEDDMEGGIVGFYTSKNQFSSEPMWVKTSFPGIIFAFLQLEKSWIIDFLLLKHILYHRMNPFYTIYKYFSSHHDGIDDLPSTIDNIDNDHGSKELGVDHGFQKKDRSYLVSESQQITADIAQFHGKVLPNDWSKWLNLHEEISKLNTTNDHYPNNDYEHHHGNHPKLQMTERLSNLTRNSSGLLESNFSTLWVRSEYQIFVTPNTVRVTNKHFLLQTFGLIMSIIFSLNYLNLFYSVFPYYRGEVPKLTVSPLIKFLSCNLLNSYHDKQ
ncbi:transmembrane domain-containing protein [Cryptosporidium canis]|uniref:Transmembrane domain-containing protein n=1 Tax=Cryptosporidium canis TaxID=195482 RepID=A0A9D5DEV8_9CRYT|nr:transmembrane domain-containing protein [Cryptosporidium canis]